MNLRVHILLWECAYMFLVSSLDGLCVTEAQGCVTYVQIFCQWVMQERDFSCFLYKYYCYFQGSFVKSKNSILAWVVTNAIFELYIITVTIYICGYLQYYRLYVSYKLIGFVPYVIWFKCCWSMIHMREQKGFNHNRLTNEMGISLV